MKNSDSQISIKQIKEDLEKTDIKDIKECIEKYSLDERASVVKLLETYNKKYDKYLAEIERIRKLKEYETELYSKGYKIIAGTDEVGRGPLFGPVCSCVIIMKPDSNIPEINDSKKLTEAKREYLYDRILADAIDYQVTLVDNNVIDEINILNATKNSMITGLHNLKVKPDILLLDAVKLDDPIEQRSIIKGDATCYTISCASIVAKVTRDRLIDEYDKLYPEYDLKNNKGYGSSKHIEALKKYGPTPLHRKTFIKNFVGQTLSRAIPLSDNGEILNQASRFILSKGLEIIHVDQAGYIVVKDDHLTRFITVASDNSDEVHNKIKGQIDTSKYEVTDLVFEKLTVTKFDSSTFSIKYDK